MAKLSFMLSRALARGRADKGVPTSRAAILVALLRKRAEAHRLGLSDHEQRLRDQITWSLPIQDGEQRPESADAA
ncbi:MAG TPA: hypothetical protein VES64_07095 [Allosphingosinicella sp.]|nr:hypothetical protein [Allosphingosinicella sp.]